VADLSVQIAARGTGLRFDDESKKLYMTYSGGKESEGITVGQDLSGYATEDWVNE
jgi:ribosomal protein S6E (S10)